MWLLELKSVFKNLILPPTGPLAVALLGALLIRRKPRTARVLVLLGAGSLWLLATPLFSDVLTGLAEHYPTLDWHDAATAQAIVILGGGGQRANAPEYGGPAAEPYLLERLAYGAFVARKTGLPILVTGFQIEAAAMRASLEQNFGIEPRWVESRSYDTFENARNSVRMLQADGVRRVVLVTRATHMWRSVHEFTSAGVEVVPAPAGMLTPRDTGWWRYLPHADTLFRTYGALNELIGEPIRAFLAAAHLRRQS